MTVSLCYFFVLVVVIFFILYSPPRISTSCYFVGLLLIFGVVSCGLLVACWFGGGCSILAFFCWFASFSCLVLSGALVVCYIEAGSDDRSSFATL